MTSDNLRQNHKSPANRHVAHPREAPHNLGVRNPEGQLLLCTVNVRRSSRDRGFAPRADTNCARIRVDIEGGELGPALDQPPVSLGPSSQLRIRTERRRSFEARNAECLIHDRPAGPSARRAAGRITAQLAPDPFVLSLATNREGIQVADPVQLYLDCRAAGERALEAADAIRTEMMW
jgi:hypothetical protein